MDKWWVVGDRCSVAMVMVGIGVAVSECTGILILGDILFFILLLVLAKKGGRRRRE